MDYTKKAEGKAVKPQCYVYKMIGDQVPNIVPTKAKEQANKLIVALYSVYVANFYR